MSDQGNYRVVATSEYGATLSYAETIEDAKAIAEAVDGVIECYVFGIGWVKWCAAMRAKN